MQESQRIVAYAPVKLNNERLPNKNILPFYDGSPLCARVLSTLKSVEGISAVYAFCSDDSIKAYLPEGVEHLPRSKDLDSFKTIINEVCHAFTLAVDADIYVYAQVTSPFLSKETVTAGLNAVLSGEYDSAVSVKRIQDFTWMKGVPYNFDPANIPRTQDMEPYFIETGALYIYKREAMILHNRRCGFKPFMIEVSAMEAIDVDYKEDFEFADAVLRYINSIKKEE